MSVSIWQENNININAPDRDVEISVDYDTHPSAARGKELRITVMLRDDAGQKTTVSFTGATPRHLISVIENQFYREIVRQNGKDEWVGFWSEFADRALKAATTKV